MSRFKFCLISPYDAEQLRHGYKLSCRDHRHINRTEVLQLTGGGKARTHIEPNKELIKLGHISYNFHPVADWAMMADGSESKRHIVLRAAREWRSIHSVMQFVPIGGKGRSTGNRYKVHCRPPRAPKRGQVKMVTPAMAAGVTSPSAF